MNFAARLSDARKKAGLTQDQLAERLEVSRQTISKWEGGQAQPEAGRIAVLADVLGVTCDALLRDEPPQTVQVQMTGTNSFTIDWASLYPILTRYQSEMDCGRYAKVFRQMIEETAATYGYSLEDAMLALKDLFAQTYMDMIKK